MPEQPTDNSPVVGRVDARPGAATIIATHEGWVLSVSGSLADLLEHSRDPAIKLNWLELVHPDDVVTASLKSSAVADTGHTQQVHLRMWSSEHRWVEMHFELRAADAGLLALDLVGRPGEAVAVRPSTAQDAEIAAQNPEIRTASPTDQIGQGVPAERALARLKAGGSSTPMVEIDQGGRTVFVGGDWESLVGADISGADALEALLNASHQAHAVMAAIGTAMDDATAADVEIALPGGGRRWVKVVPIPAPNQPGALNVLVGVAGTKELVATPEAPRSPRNIVAGGTLAGGTVTGDSIAREMVAGDAVVGDTIEAPSVAPKDPAPIRGLRRPLRDRLAPVQEWVERRQLTWGQVAFACGIVLVALLLRTWDLSGVPTGFHGDEAIFGQESQRVIDDGSIGIYTGSALGQPTAPFYIGAISIGLFGPSVWAARIVAAIAGVMTVAAVYLIAQRRFDHRVAAASALALATMSWSIHFSRIAFPLAWWPLIVLFAVAAIDRATQSGDARWWFAAGALSAFGVYVYNSHWLFGVAVLAFMGVWLLWRHDQPADRRVRTLIWGPLGALLVLWPMISYARNDANGYFNHFDSVSRRNGQEWTEAGFFHKARLGFDWYTDAWNSLLFDPTGDFVDASGVVKQIPLIFTVLAFVGVLQLLLRHRTAFAGLMLVTVLVLPLGPAMTIDGITRREFAMSPFVAILAGIGAVAVLDIVNDRLNATAGRYVAAAMVAIVLFTSVVPYFTTFRNSDQQKWVFAEELTESVDIIQDAEDDGPVFVNWFSARHYYQYETLAFLLDGTPGIDRAPLDQGFVENPALSLYPDTSASQLYVLVGDYSSQLGQLQDLYPRGSVVADRHAPRVAAYLVPSG